MIPTPAVHPGVIALQPVLDETARILTSMIAYQQMWATSPTDWVTLAFTIMRPLAAGMGKTIAVPMEPVESYDAAERLVRAAWDELNSISPRS
jgi:hypothetical protein